MALLTELRQRYGLTLLMVTHDLEIARYADRVLTLRDGALGQDLSGLGDDSPTLDEGGRIQLPETVREQLAEAARISVEIRPEGVLLRPEADPIDDTQAALQDMLPQDAPPERRRWFRRGKKVKS
jgi:energy-coupling factor transporter ATP-binding protein EcfA2